MALTTSTKLTLITLLFGMGLTGCGARLPVPAAPSTRLTATMPVAAANTKSDSVKQSLAAALSKAMKTPGIYDSAMVTKLEATPAPRGYDGLYTFQATVVVVQHLRLSWKYTYAVSGNYDANTGKLNMVDKKQVSAERTTP